MSTPRYKIGKGVSDGTFGRRSRRLNVPPGRRGRRLRRGAAPGGGTRPPSAPRASSHLYARIGGGFFLFAQRLVIVKTRGKVRLGGGCGGLAILDIITDCGRRAYGIRFLVVVSFEYCFLLFLK